MFVNTFLDHLLLSDNTFLDHLLLIDHTFLNHLFIVFFKKIPLSAKFFLPKLQLSAKLERFFSIYIHCIFIEFFTENLRILRFEFV